MVVGVAVGVLCLGLFVFLSTCEHTNSYADFAEGEATGNKNKQNETVKRLLYGVACLVQAALDSNQRKENDVPFIK
jgi:hypothetical protein